MARRFDWLMMAAIILVGIRPADAYMDPGTGSMLSQIILSGVGGLLVLLRIVWRHFISSFQQRR